MDSAGEIRTGATDRDGVFGRNENIIPLSLRLQGFPVVSGLQARHWGRDFKTEEVIAWQQVRDGLEGLGQSQRDRRGIKKYTGLIPRFRPGELD